MPGPLDGVRVLDLTSVVLGPLATQTLGDLGAAIVKIEGPSGDTTRYTGPKRSADMSALFMGLNRNKRSIVLDLKQDAAKDVLRRLIDDADVFLHSIRPQAIERLGFGPEPVLAQNARIVYAGVHGFRMDGPYSGRPAYDDVIQGLSGSADLMARLVGEPRYMPTIMADKTCGLVTVNAILAALYEREQSGEGQFVEVPMLETMVSFNLVEHINGCAYEPPISELGYARVMTAFRRPFPTKDGFVCMLPYSDKHWLNFFTSVGRPELMEDPRFSTYLARIGSVDDLYGFVGECTPDHTTAEWVEICDEQQIPCMPIIDLDDLLEDEHLNAVGMFEKHQHPTEGETLLVRAPVKYAKTPNSIRRHAPRFGEHGAEVLHELGYDEDSIDKLMKVGAVLTDTKES